MILASIRTRRPRFTVAFPPALPHGEGVDRSVIYGPSVSPSNLQAPRRSKASIIVRLRGRAVSWRSAGLQAVPEHSCSLPVGIRAASQRRLAAEVESTDAWNGPVNREEVAL